MFVLVFSSGCHFSDASLAFRTSTGSLHEQPDKIRHGALAREPRLKLLPLVFKRKVVVCQPQCRKGGLYNRCRRLSSSGVRRMFIPNRIEVSTNSRCCGVNNAIGDILFQIRKWTGLVQHGRRGDHDLPNVNGYRGAEYRLTATP